MADIVAFSLAAYATLICRLLCFSNWLPPYTARRRRLPACSVFITFRLLPFFAGFSLTNRPVSAIRCADVVAAARIYVAR